MRRKRKNELEEEIQDITQMIRFKEKRCSQAETTRNYKICDQLTEEQMELKKRKRDLEAELTVFCRKEKRARRHRTMTMLSSSPSSETSRSPTPFLHPKSPFSSAPTSPLTHSSDGGSSSETEAYSGELSIHPPEEAHF